MARVARRWCVTGICRSVKVFTGMREVRVRHPRIADRRPVGQREEFDRTILPPYLRRTQSLNKAIPWMCLYGISTNDMAEPLEALLGPSPAKGASPTTVARLVESWKLQYAEWNQRSLVDKQYVYLCPDGVYFNIQMGDDDSACFPVVLEATVDGQNEILAMGDGYRESEQSWANLLLDLKSRGLTVSPKLATGDGG